MGPLRRTPAAEYNGPSDIGEHGIKDAIGYSVEAQGKHVIIFIFTTALAAAVFAWTFQFMRGRRVLELWGADNARLIRIESEQIQILSLTPAGGANETDAPRSLKIDDQPYSVVDEIEITKARGIANARQALIEDATFQWDKPRGDCQPAWEFALEFRSGQRAATVLLDTNCQRAKLLETGNEAAIHPKIFAGWTTFIGEHVADTKQE